MDETQLDAAYEPPTPTVPASSEAVTAELAARGGIGRELVDGERAVELVTDLRRMQLDARLTSVASGSRDPLPVRIVPTPQPIPQPVIVDARGRQYRMSLWGVYM